MGVSIEQGGCRYITTLNRTMTYSFFSSASPWNRIRWVWVLFGGLGAIRRLFTQGHKARVLEDQLANCILCSRQKHLNVTCSTEYIPMCSRVVICMLSRVDLFSNPGYIGSRRPLPLLSSSLISLIPSTASSIRTSSSSSFESPSSLRLFLLLLT